jgi:hypothetical protein
VFPYGILVDTKNRTYLTSKVNSLFLAKSQFQRVSEGSIKKLPTKNDEESSLVAGAMLPDLRPGESEMGMLYERKPVFAALTTFFFIAALMKASFQRAPIKKARIEDPGFL